MAAAQKPGRWWPLLAMAMLLAVIGLTFWPVLSGGFIGIDDGNNIFLNPQMGVLNWARVAWAFSDFESARRYMPLGWLGFAAVFTWQGLAPLGYHAACLGWQMLGAIAFYLAVRNILRLEGEPGDQRWGVFVSVLIAAAWALHPLRTEAVGWASGILYTQGATLAFTALWLWTLRWDRPEKSGWLAAASCLALATSLLTYPIALGFPVVGWLLDRRAGKFRPAFAPQVVPTGGVVGLILVMGTALALTLVASGKNSGNFAATATLTDFGLLQRLLQAVYVWGRYLQQLVCPADLSLAYTDLYSLNPLGNNVRLTIICSLILLAVVAGLVWRKWISIDPWLAYSAMALPFLGLLEHPWIAHDRYATLLHPVWLVAGGLALYRMQHPKLRLTLAFVAVGWVAGWAVETRSLTSHWKDHWALHERLSQTLPRDPWAGYYLGTVPASVLFLDGRFDEIGPQLDRAEASAPGWSAGPVREEYRGLIRQHEAFLAANWPGRKRPPVAVLHFLHGRSAEERCDWATARAHFEVAWQVAGDFSEARAEIERCDAELRRLEGERR